jgi:tRNA(Phe) wybutosine-synthesizing methylase Tyw3
VKILIHNHHPSTLDEVMTDLKSSSLQLVQLITQKNLSHLLAVAQAAK